MVIGKIIDIDLEQSVTHISTDWEVSTDPLFDPSARVCNSIADTVNLTDIVFNDILDPTIKYYGRARLLLSTGYTVWGNIHIFTPIAIEDLDLDMTTPSVISVPKIVLNDSAEHFPVIGFTINVTDFSVNGDSSHIATTWIIDDCEGNIVWRSIMDRSNKESICVFDYLLKDKQLYRIRAIFHSDSNDVSQIATKTIVTSGNKDLTILTKLYDVDHTSDLHIDILEKSGVTSLTAKLFYIGDNEYSEVWSKVNTTNLFKLTIPSSVLKDNKLFVFKVKTDVDPEYNTKLLSTY